MVELLVLIVAALTAFDGPVCVAPEGFESMNVNGELRAGDRFDARFGGRFTFGLTPSQFGWTIEVHERGRDEDLARLTPPWHFVPNPRFVEGWHFRNASNTGPNDGSVNAPQERREFFFSPEVGRSLEYEGSGTPTAVVEQVRAFGRGRLTLLGFRLTPVGAGERASFEEVLFDVCLVWRTADST